MTPNYRTLALIALLSGLATALVIHAGLAKTRAQKAALVALAHPQTVTAAQQGETIVALAPHRPAPNATPATTPAANTATRTTASLATTTTAAATTTTSAAPTDVGLPKVGHVFLVALSASPRAGVFGRGSAAPYLRSLAAKGTLLSGYGSLGHGELADELALLSGQAPNRDTSAGCPRFSAFAQSAAANAKGLVAGNGCVYPDTTLSLADQVVNAGHQWGAYVTGMGTTPCETPQTGGSLDAALTGVDAAYDVVHNPFVFFSSLTGSGECYESEGDTTALPALLAAKASAVPAFTFLAPNACADGSEPDAPGDAATATTSTATSPGTTATATTTTASTADTTTTAAAGSAAAAGRDGLCPAGSASGITAEDDFLATAVPAILAAPAYRQDGVLVIALSGAGAGHGGRPYGTGALVISRWTPANRRIATAYGPYSLLRSIEDMLDLQPLGHAAGAPAFARGVLDR